MFVRRTGSSWGGGVDGYFNRSLRSLWSLRSLRKKSPAILWKPLSSDRSETIVEIELFISQRLLSLWSLESGFKWSPWSLRSLKFFFFFFFSAITAIVAIIWNRALIWSWHILNVRTAYSETSIQTVCHKKGLKASDIVRSVSISAVVWWVCWFQWLEWSYFGLFISFSE